MSLEALYDMKEFAPKFKEFTKETEFGTSAYGVCYEAGLVDRDVKDFIIKMKSGYEKDFQTIVDENIPPYHMKTLRKLVEDHLYLVDKIFKDEMLNE